MTEKEKMLKQMIYDANYDEELMAERTKAKELCYDFNQLRPSETEKQTEILKKLLGKTRGWNMRILLRWGIMYGLEQACM